ncbi:hypothetical protein [Microbacterium sp.]|uniref:COG1470 family protein n=1 Tax=Microbacterium sp. TaxID=51671 RepID=UPI0025E89CA4|nr:hypothetical protein [Microbacterium sp.]MBT9607920.1 DUF916 domain-containing protein [Microbacterium sp.]
MTRRLPLALGLVAALLLAGSAGAPAHAADDDVTWSVQPSTPAGPDGRAALSFQVSAGTVITDWVAVTNYSAAPATFRVYAADARTDYDTAAFTLINADAASTDLGAWTAVAGSNAVCAPEDVACIAAIGTTVTLDPGARADVPVTITVPADATPGDHSAGIVASLVSTASAPGGAGVSLEQRVGTRVYVRVGGALAPALSMRGLVAGYTAANPFSGTASLDVDLANTGNTRVSAAPTATLTGPFGIPLATVPLSGVDDIVPGGVAHVSAELPDVPPLVLLFADVRISPTAATGALPGDPLPAVVTGSVIAWAVPWLVLLALFVLAALVALAIWWRRRARARLADDIAAYADIVRAEERDAAARASTDAFEGTK